MLELAALEHQVSVVSLSNPEATAKIEGVQKQIQSGLREFGDCEKAADVDKAQALVYQGIGAKILELKVILSGSQLPDTIDELFEMNQQITLDLNEEDQDTAEGVEIEAQLEQLGDQIEERQEQNGFLTDQDIAQMQSKVTELIGKISTQEANRDAMMVSKQVRTETEEIRETFDSFATVANDYFKLKSDLVRVEAEVYEFGRIL